MQKRDVFKTFLFGCFLIKTLFVFSQNDLKKSIFEEEFKYKSKKFLSQSNFREAHFSFILKDWDATLEYSMKQLSLKNNSTELNNYCFFLRGISFKKKKLFEESKNEFSKISKAFAFDHFVRMYLGEIALEQKKFRSAIGYFNELEQLSVNQLVGLDKANVKHNLGLCYLHLEEFDKAEFYLLESVKKEENINDSTSLVDVYGDVANLYYVQYKDDLAILYFQKAYELSKRSDNFLSKQNASFNMAIIEENRNQYFEALKYRKEYEQWRDSLNDQNKVWEVAQREKKFAVQQKQKEVSLLEAENKIKIAQRNSFFYFTVVLFVLLSVTIYFYTEKIKSNKIILEQKQNLDELNAAKDNLFSIISHDLRSSVNAMKRSNVKLQENLENKNFRELDKQLLDNRNIANGMYNLLDNLLHWALLQTEQIYFSKESLRLYFIVEQVVYNYKPLMIDKNIMFKNNVSKNDVVYVDQESLKIILRNLIDNAIKFSNSNGLISIYSRNSNRSSCELVIEDNGIGMSDSTKNELLKDTQLLARKKNQGIIGTGLGLQLSKSMVKKNTGILTIESEEELGTKIIICFPKN